MNHSHAAHVPQRCSARQDESARNADREALNTQNISRIYDNEAERWLTSVAKQERLHGRASSHPAARRTGFAFGRQPRQSGFIRLGNTPAPGRLCINCNHARRRTGPARARHDRVSNRDRARSALGPAISPKNQPARPTRRGFSGIPPSTRPSLLSTQRLPMLMTAAHSTWRPCPSRLCI